MPLRLRPVLILAFASLALAGCGGQRYLKIRIENNGEVILATEYGVSDRLEPRAIWQSLRGKPFRVIGKFDPEADDPCRAVLRGRITLAIDHVNTPIARAEVTELRLRKSRKADNQWELADEEVVRTSQAAGL